MSHFKNIYCGKKVLITGHTGFKGSWLTVWLKMLGAEIIGVSFDVPSNPSNYEVNNVSELNADHRIDVRDLESIKKILDSYKPDYIFHLAAQALVRPAYENPLDTISINSLGSATMLEAVRNYDKNVVIVMITSDKAYDNFEWVWGYRESDRLGGKDPYSASKGMAELAIRSYVDSYFLDSDRVRVGITRAGNVIGGGDWAQDRIVPDCMKAWSREELVDIRSPNSTRPWQHVLEPLSGYLTLGARLSGSKQLSGQAFNFGPAANQNYSVKELIEEMAKYWNSVRWNDVSDNEGHVHEAGLLKLNCDKAYSELGWLPSLSFQDTVRMTVEWYKKYYQSNGASMFEFTKMQITEYTKIANGQNLEWVN